MSLGTRPATTRKQYRLVRTYRSGNTTSIEYGDLRNAEDALARTRDTLPNIKARIQTRTATTTYSDWEDVS